ncbi:MAG: LPS export ABC transporter periplasmic protein LptC [Holosporales bacterium]|jgi:hypothetical protein|nr:LPS export ABC transporter periplasmic protein LptC [Holosporales bacterium]
MNSFVDFKIETKIFGKSMIDSYTFFVRIGRFFLLSALVIFLGILIAFPIFWKESGVSSQIAKKYQNFSLDNKLYDAVFVSSHGDSPYQVGAQHAESFNNDHVVLKNPDSTLYEKGRNIHVASEKGLYDQLGEKLVLEKDVTLTTTDGYEVKAPSATIDLKTKNLSGKEITGKGPLGSLVAPEFAIRDQGNEIILTGPSSLVISMK